VGRLLINCDLGENETDEQTARLFGLVDAASICCGVHAGSEAKTRRTLQIAAGHKVMIGAHPGMAATGGRGSELPTPADFRDLIEAQVTKFIVFADEQDVSVDYVKLHGSLYHAVEQDRGCAKVYLELLACWEGKLGVFALGGGRFAAQAIDAGIKVWSEGFADRAYLRNGSLAPRAEAGAILEAAAALARLTQWQGSGMMDTLDGDPFALQFDTLCVHSDSPDAEILLQDIKHLIDRPAAKRSVGDDPED